MKTRLLLILALVGFFAYASAQEKQTIRVSALKSQRVEKGTYPVDFSKVVKNSTSIVAEMEGVAGAVKAPQADLSYAKPIGTYHASFFLNETSGNLSARYPTIVGKSDQDWTFVASGGSDYTWTINDQALETVAGNGIFNVPCGSYYLPKVASGSQSFIWHEPVGRQFGSVSDELHSLSMVDVWKDSDASGFGNLSGFGNYGYGTGEMSDGAKRVSAVQEYEAPQAPLYIESVNGAIFSNSNNPLPGDNYLTCLIYPLLPNGKPDWENPIAESDCYGEDLEDWGQLFSDGTKLFNAPFYFYEYDEETGLRTPVNLTISTGFAVEIGWTSGADFGFVFGYSDGDGKKSYVFDENGSGWIFSANNGSGSTPVDIYINLKGAMTTLTLDDRIESITIPATGGESQVVYTGEGTYSNAIFNSTFGVDDLEFADELPEWLTLTGAENETDEEGYFLNAVSLVFAGEALPAGITGRKADVTLSTYGTSATFTITQGDGGVGISPVKAVETKAARQGDDFKLTYPASATSVAVYNVTGQKVGDYPLNASGSYTLPAAGWANGVYILKFNGSNTTVKVIK